MKKKLVSVVLTAAMTATLFAGCGSSAADPADTSMQARQQRLQRWIIPN